MTHIYVIYSSPASVSSGARASFSKLTALKAATDRIPEYAKRTLEVRNTGATHQDGAEYRYTSSSGVEVTITVERVEVER